MDCSDEKIKLEVDPLFDQIYRSDCSNEKRC